MKYENEITVEVNMTKEELIKHLEENNYNKIDNYILYDNYYVLKDADLNSNTLDILKKCILIRNIDDKKYYLTYKYKEYDDNENIIKQGKSNVSILNTKEAKTFLESIGYKELIDIKDEINVYEKNGLELCIEFVNDKYLYIEIEENEKYDTVEKLIKALEETNINYNKNNYFVKKAKIIFEEKYIKKY